MVAASLYRPLQFVGDNAWDLDSPLKPILIGLGVAVAGTLLLMTMVRFGIEPRAAALGVSTLILILFYWYQITVPAPLKLAIPVLITLVSIRIARTTMIGGLTFVALAVFGLYPLAQLVLAHVEQSEAYPIVASPKPTRTVVATESVEDVVFVVVDTYPSFLVAEPWIGHENSALEQQLDTAGFATPDSAWAQLTFTFLSVASTLEMRPIAIAGPLPPWRNESSVRQLLRGENLVATALQSAGFDYTHLESGLSGMGCGPTVDHCVPAHWLDEATWLLLMPSIAARPLDSQFGYFSVPATLEAAKHLEQVLDIAASNGAHDYVFSHFFLPHPPLAVDAECGVREDVLYVNDGSDRRSDRATLDAFSGQLSCADTLISRLTSSVSPKTAILITADHGTGLGGQVNRDGATWTDGDIGERLATLLAYHLPAGCDSPADEVNIDVMRAIMACATDLELPTRDTTVFLGADNPYVVDPERMAGIRQGVENGTLDPFNP